MAGVFIYKYPCLYIYVRLCRGIRMCIYTGMKPETHNPPLQMKKKCERQQTHMEMIITLQERLNLKEQYHMYRQFNLFWNASANQLNENYKTSSNKRLTSSHFVIFPGVKSDIAINVFHTMWYALNFHWQSIDQYAVYTESFFVFTETIQWQIKRLYLKICMYKLRPYKTHTASPPLNIRTHTVCSMLVSSLKYC